jgi:hypothetical protein
MMTHLRRAGLITVLLIAGKAFTAGTTSQPVTNTGRTELVSTPVNVETDAITIPRLINYQGKLTDASGNPITGTKSLVFKVWDVLSAGTTPLWSETQSVTVTDGIFSVLLGSSTPIPGSAVLQSGACYLEITVEGVTIEPRTQLVSVPYAYKADTADYAPTLRPLSPQVGSDEIADAAVTMPKIDGTGANTGQVIMWSSSTWAPATLGGVASLASPVSVSNSGAETELLGVTLPADLLREGTHLRVTANGVASTASPGPTVTWRCTVGGVGGTVVTRVTTSVNNDMTNKPWMVQFDVTVRTAGVSGTIIGNGCCWNELAGNLPSACKGSGTVTAVSVDTTQPNEFGLTFQFSTANASNTLTCHNAVIEVVKP